jgi:uncharacterized YccA/Bax inhibitor family protein
VANALLEKTLDREAEGRPGWAAPTTATQGTATRTAPTGGPPAAVTEPMTFGGVTSASGVLFVLLLVAGAVGWSLVTPGPTGEIDFPGWLFLPLLGAFGLAIWAMFRPTVARFVAPIYALLEGLVLGAISRVFENEWNGIVVQAIALTAIVFASMLFLYSTRIIKVTERMQRVIIGATLGIAVFYGVSLLLSLFNVGVPLIWDAGPFGIIFSLFVCGIAAFNLMLDFDLVERGVAAGLPKYMEWFCALSLMISIVWLYLEILRLLSKLRQ